MATDREGRPLRVVCGFCGSQHNYRGGGDDRSDVHAPPPQPPRLGGGQPAAISPERIGPKMPSDHAHGDLEALLRRVIREESGLTPVVPAERWRGGQLVLRPGRPGVQEKAWPIETFFHKVVMLRNRLRTLEQQVNASDLPDDLKIKLQTYVTGCYGSLTSFNVLFAEEDDHFRGTGGR
jgi:hypothetical protein